MAVENAASLRILVVDDDPSVRVLAKTMLNDAGFLKVTATEDPLNALSRLQRGLADFVFLDWKLPKLSGLEVLKTIRTNDKLLPIIMISSENDRDKIVLAIKAGATDYIFKPFTKEILVEKLESAMERKKVVKQQMDDKGLT